MVKELVYVFLGITNPDSVNDYCAGLGTVSKYSWTVGGSSYQMDTNNWANRVCGGVLGIVPACCVQLMDQRLKPYRHISIKTSNGNICILRRVL